MDEQQKLALVELIGRCLKAIASPSSSQTRGNVFSVGLARHELRRIRGTIGESNLAVICQNLGYISNGSGSVADRDWVAPPPARRPAPKMTLTPSGLSEEQLQPKMAPKPIPPKHTPEQIREIHKTALGNDTCACETCERLRKLEPLPIMTGSEGNGPSRWSLLEID